MSPLSPKLGVFFPPSPIFSSPLRVNVLIIDFIGACCRIQLHWKALPAFLRSTDLVCSGRGDRIAALGAMSAVCNLPKFNAGYDHHS